MISKFHLNVHQKRQIVSKFFLRQGRNINIGQLSISVENKKYLLSLLPLIDAPFYAFYQGLKTKNELPNDLEEFDPDQQHKIS